MVSCHDCQKELKDEGVHLRYGEIEIDKCDECYKKDKSLRNFQECEVYSRVVGFYRPVKQWHQGKQEEFKDRVAYESKI